MYDVRTIHLHIIFDSLITLLRINQIILLMQFANISVYYVIAQHFTEIALRLNLSSLIIQQMKYESIILTKSIYLYTRTLFYQNLHLCSKLLQVQ